MQRALTRLVGRLAFAGELRGCFGQIDLRR